MKRLTKARRKTSWVTRKVITRKYHWISFSVPRTSFRTCPLWSFPTFPIQRFSDLILPPLLFYVVQKSWHRKSSIRASTSSVNMEKIKIKWKETWVHASIRQEVITELRGRTLTLKLLEEESTAINCRNYPFYEG